MLIIKKEPNREPDVMDVSEDIEELQAHVGGYLEPIPVQINNKWVLILCNEDGKRLKKPANIKINGTTILGTILVVGMDGDHFGDCPVSADEFKEWGCTNG